MSFRVDSAWIPGAFIVGDDGLGVLGSEIASSGDAGPGYAYNDLSLPADADKEICGRITTWPSAGTLYAYEDTSFTFTGAPDGVYTFQYQLYVDGVATGSPATVTLTVGSGAVAGSAAWTEENDTASGAGTVAVTGTSGTTEANDSAAGSGFLTVSGTSATVEADDSISASGSVFGGDGGTAAWTEEDDAAAGQGVVCARAPRGSGYRRPFINTKRPRN